MIFHVIFFFFRIVRKTFTGRTLSTECQPNVCVTTFYTELSTYLERQYFGANNSYRVLHMFYYVFTYLPTAYEYSTVISSGM